MINVNTHTPFYVIINTGHLFTNLIEQQSFVLIITLKMFSAHLTLHKQLLMA